MNKLNGKSNKRDMCELAKIGHTLSSALFEGDLDRCIAIILDHGNNLGYEFSFQSAALLQQANRSPNGKLS